MTNHHPLKTNHCPVNPIDINDDPAIAEVIKSLMANYAEAARNLAKWKTIIDNISGGRFKKKPWRNPFLDHLTEIAKIFVGVHSRNKLLEVPSLCDEVKRKLHLKSDDFDGLGDAIEKIDKLFFDQTGHFLSCCLVLSHLDKRPLSDFVDFARTLGQLSKTATEKEQWNYWATNVDFCRELGEEKLDQFVEARLRNGTST